MSPMNHGKSIIADFWKIKLNPIYTLCVDSCLSGSECNTILRQDASKQRGIMHHNNEARCNYSKKGMEKLSRRHHTTNFMRFRVIQGLNVGRNIPFLVFLHNIILM